MRTSKINAGLFFAALMVASTGCMAGNVTGTINSSLTLVNSCQVNGSSATTGANFGALNFGTNSTLSSEATAQVLGSGGGAMSIQCSKGAIPVVKIGVGANDGRSTGGYRAMAGPAGNFIAYDLFGDSGFNLRFATNATITLPVSTGTAHTINIYGRAVVNPGLPAGTYTDTVAIELAF